MSNRRNLANVILKDPVSDSATTWELVAGYGDAMPPAVPYHLTATPFGQLSTLGNSEVVLVTARTADTLTVVRGQKGTTAQSFLAGAVISNGIMVDDVIGTEVTVATAAATAAKVGTTTDGNYTPVLGDRIIVTFVNGSNVATPTLNIDGSGAKNIRLGQTNANTLTMGLGTTAGSNVKIQMWYDGTYWQLYGANDNTNTTYTEITTAEIDDGTASTSRTITGRRVDYIQDKTLERAYPVGSIYISTVSTNPSTLFGFGTWVAYGGGRVIVGKAASGTFGTAGATGGAETHTLTVAEMPSHNHNWRSGNGIANSGSQYQAAINNAGYDTYAPTDYQGGGAAHNNLQPYIVAYMWNRTA